MKLEHFAYAHLPPQLAEVSKHFHDVAHQLCNMLPASAERTSALRKLWEAKNLAVIAMIDWAPGSALPRHPASLGAGLIKENSDEA